MKLNTYIFARLYHSTNYILDSLILKTIADWLNDLQKNYLESSQKFDILPKLIIENILTSF
jgi:hypothetical protein